MDIKPNWWEEENWQIYRQRYPDGIVSSRQGETGVTVELLSSRSGLPTMRVTAQNGQEVFLHSSMDPVREAQRVAGKLEAQAGVAVVVYGLSLGYLIEALLVQLDERIPLFVIEPDQTVFEQAMRERDLRGILSSQRVNLQVGDSVIEMENNFFNFYDPIRFHNIVLTGLPGHQEVYKDFYLQATQGIKRVVDGAVMEMQTLAKIGPDMVSSTIQNFYHFCTQPGVNALFEKFAGVPAIVVAAGPALNQNIVLLREAKGKAVLIAVGTAVKALQQQGIVPDFIVSIDPMVYNYEHFKEYSGQDAVLLTDIQSYPAILQAFRGPIFVAANQSFILSWPDGVVEDKGDLETGGTAAHSAMTAAYKMGANPIVFVGQDLAFASDGSTHAAGTNYGEAGNKIYKDGDNAGFLYVKANQGEQVLTSRLFNQYRLFFEKWVQVKNDRLYINATEGGALIEGMQVMTLREVLDSHCQREVDVRPVISQSRQDFYKLPIKQVLAILKQRLADANQVVADTKSALNRLKKLQQAYQEKDFAKVNQYALNIDEIFRRLEQEPYICPAVKLIEQHFLHQILRRRYEALYAEDNDVPAAIADYRLYYEKVREAAQRIKEFIEQSIAYIQNEKI
ncbi:Hypothetical protein LUCI_0740 [Lucifera butyrica]|uniref:6-hydroxymethylpterin diphosphokinase MptE-like domain-containing protein n=1 Tax=Lucifera butyrica TaxID=1351585 RepID=A0A498R3Z0_9FIRM|nr:6-hydroxymethylpterin diphosphokinase MptE-like protein [Lucifera butyrica]VBB05530.1 Hypothetical protein LUCI_0740 [Lucifera butyrica]